MAAARQVGCGWMRACMAAMHAGARDTRSLQGVARALTLSQRGGGGGESARRRLRQSGDADGNSGVRRNAGTFIIVAAGLGLLLVCIVMLGCLFQRQRRRARDRKGVRAPSCMHAYAGANHGPAAAHRTSTMHALHACMCAW
jgi:hypothetical protein